MWEKEWQLEGLPDLGDFIAVQMDDQGEITYDVGFVIEIRDELVRLHNDPPLDPSTDYPYAVKWKRWIGPEIEQAMLMDKKIRQSV